MITMGEQNGTGAPFAFGCVTYYGLSTDNSKPTTDVANGSAFVEMDTSKLYFYDAEGETWREWGASE